MAYVLPDVVMHECSCHIFGITVMKNLDVGHNGGYRFWPCVAVCICVGRTYDHGGHIGLVVVSCRGRGRVYVEDMKYNGLTHHYSNDSGVYGVVHVLNVDVLVTEGEVHRSTSGGLVDLLKEGYLD